MIFRQEQRGIRQAEAVNALLHISHGKKIMRLRLYQQGQNGLLNPVDILVLIHHDLLIFFLQGKCRSSRKKLSRRRLGYDVQRWGAPVPYPPDSPRGPLVALTNELAGSDGDIFSHVFKLMGLGPLVGKRTWGGVIGIWPRHRLVDGTVTTQPEFAFWFEDVGWGVENHGTDPDVVVEFPPQDHAAGRDPQLEAALALAQEELERRPPAGPRPEERPYRGRPGLSGLAPSP